MRDRKADGGGSFPMSCMRGAINVLVGLDSAVPGIVTAPEPGNDVNCSDAAAISRSSASGS